MSLFEINAHLQRLTQVEKPLDWGPEEQAAATAVIKAWRTRSLPERDDDLFTLVYISFGDDPPKDLYVGSFRLWEQDRNKLAFATNTNNERVWVIELYRTLDVPRGFALAKPRIEVKTFLCGVSVFVQRLDITDLMAGEITPPEKRPFAWPRIRFLHRSKR